MLQWNTIRPDQSECYGLNPMTQACIQWSLSFKVSAPINITVYSTPAMAGKSQSVVPSGGQYKKGENLYKIKGLFPGLPYTFTVVIMSGLWRNEKTSQIYYACKCLYTVSTCGSVFCKKFFFKKSTIQMKLLIIFFHEL